MSVLVKDMDLPENCFSCPLKEEGFCNITNAYAAQIYKRNSDCPLVELPEHHGRLIDVDEMKLNFTMSDDCSTCDEDWKHCQYDREYSKMVFCGWIDDQPIVVEAEDGEIL